MKNIMKNKVFKILFIVLFVTLENNLNAVDQGGYVGKVWKSEKVTWIDKEFGHEITKWTSDKYRSWPLYFDVESFIDKNHVIIYSNRSGGINLFRLDLINGTMVQMTNEKGNISGSVWYIPKYKILWYKIGNTIHSLNSETFENKVVFQTDSLEIKSFSITVNKKYLVFSVNKNPGFSDNCSTGPYAIFRFGLTDGSLKQITPDYGFIISHVQANPVNPDIIIYAWQHRYRPGSSGIVGNTPIRIWWVNIKGTKGGPVGPQEFGLHRTHEFWTYDGKRIGYSARYKFGPNLGKQYLGSCKPDGSDNFMFKAPVGPAHSQIYKDNKHWVADQNNGMILTLWTFDRGKVIKEEKLFRHNSSWNGQPSHPHPHFSPEGKKIIFGTDRTGTPCVYTVKINLDDQKWK
ncbi:oligogalacturonate lyase [bacterium BMS3Abin04]|nr:oligogalacturonate lyase [bacterium BMS3Abin04]